MYSKTAKLTANYTSKTRKYRTKSSSREQGYNSQQQSKNYSRTSAQGAQILNLSQKEKPYDKSYGVAKKIYNKYSQGVTKSKNYLNMVQKRQTYNLMKVQNTKLRSQSHDKPKKGYQLRLTNSHFAKPTIGAPAKPESLTNRDNDSFVGQKPPDFSKTMHIKTKPPYIPKKYLKGKLRRPQKKVASQKSKQKPNIPIPSTQSSSKVRRGRQKPNLPMPPMPPTPDRGQRHSSKPPMQYKGKRGKMRSIRVKQHKHSSKKRFNSSQRKRIRM